ncbi:MAG: enoyl-CoA hydratase/isomerase family protein [Chloroflexi bacterium]|nr:enoyl-CoA hydratase/isomerase family protein [Chloroflexota bacterium]MCH8196341.1 enoyl-CoA hydratase/isomerase family protein [Chloroflexota bacterium]
MSAFETILFESKDGVALVTLNRPKVLNAYNVQMRDDLYEALGLIDADDEIRVVVFRGAGDRAFCAGADLTEFGTAPSQAIARQVRFERDVWGRLLGLRQPVIAAVHGYCLGSGMEIALACDLRIASADARFGLPETSLGMIPAAGGTQTLPRIVGPSWALDAQLTGRMIDAREALRIGLVNRIVDQGGPFDEAARLAAHLASRDPAAVRTAKEAVVRGLDTTLDRGLDIERRLALRMALRSAEN